MPNTENNQSEKKDDHIIRSDKRLLRKYKNIDNLIKQSNLRLYGTDRESDIDDLNKRFQNIMQENIKQLSGNRDGDVSSFLSQLVSNDKKSNAMNEMLNSQISAMSGENAGSLQAFIYDAYRNKLLEQSDLHDVASQLIELSEAILITRDAIVSADVVEGRMSRSLTFKNIDKDSIEEVTPIIENMEKVFDLQKKIKNFIVPKTLEYGEFYAYVIPYSVLFNNYEEEKNRDRYGAKLYGESTLLESFDESNRNKKNNDESLKVFIESMYDEYMKPENQKSKDSNTIKEPSISKKVFEEDVKNIMSNISVCNEPIPLPYLEESPESIKYFKECYEKEHPEFKVDNGVYTEAPENVFDTLNKSEIKSDITKGVHNRKNNKKNNYSDITGCYLKMIEPTRILPVKIMNTTLGYMYVQDEDITPLSGAISDTLYYSKFDEHSRQRTVIDSIAMKVAKMFDKPFLEKNIKFKEAIIDCLNFYNLNEKRVRFQFIPADYIVEFKIDEDIDGNGTSVIKKSLFYAKLYLMILLFKIMSIILYSNDTKVNYLKQSGIDKNIANQVQEIARIRQSRQINITDLFSYTTLINKVGNGSELYIPTGRSGERPIETEILQGQDVQLNSDLLEMLKNSYILATGCPAAIINFLQESDFAKSVELSNTKWLARITNYQLDFNPSITKMYQKLMKWSTNIDENIIDNFEFTFQPQKSIAITTKADLISQFTNTRDFLTQMYFGDPGQSLDADTLTKKIAIFSRKLMAEQLPMMNTDLIEKLVAETEIEYKKEKLKPDPTNGDNGDDDGLDLDETLNDMGV